MPSRRSASLRRFSPSADGRGRGTITTLILDLDGVIYRGQQALPAAAETVAWLRQHGYLVTFLTNNSTRTRAFYARTLRHLGIPARPEDIRSSGQATARYLRQQGPPVPTVLVIGEWGLRRELANASFRLVTHNERAPVDFVVTGMDRHFNYAKLVAAQQAILHGARFIATNRDPTYPTETGLLPGGGTVVAAIEACTGVSPVVIGKPQTFIVEEILEETGARPRETMVVGDRLDADIEMGRRAGLRTVLVLTGVTSREEAETAPRRRRPHWIIDTLAELPDLLTRLGGRP